MNKLLFILSCVCVTILRPLLAPHTYCMSFPLPSHSLSPPSHCRSVLRAPSNRTRTSPCAACPYGDRLRSFSVIVAVLMSVLTLLHLHFAWNEPKRLSQGILFFTPTNGSLTLSHAGSMLLIRLWWRSCYCLSLYACDLIPPLSWPPSIPNPACFFDP